jgi:PAS domain S-box-containing protein
MDKTEVRLRTATKTKSAKAIDFDIMSDEKARAKKMLMQSEAKYQLVASLSGFIVFEYNELADKCSWSGAIKEITGYTLEEFSNFSIAQWLKQVHPIDQQHATEFYWKAMFSAIPINTEYRFKHKQGHYLWIEMHGLALSAKKNRSSGVMGIMKDISERKRHQEEILDSIIQTEEKERRSFSQELHDGLGPIHSAIKMYVQLMDQPNSQIPKKEIHDELIHLLNEANKTVKEITFKLNPRIVEKTGLKEALESYLKLINRGKVKGIICASGPIQLGLKSATTVYRILCECINNTLKHANARNLFIHINSKDNYHFITYTDDGEGFNRALQKDLNQGMGLSNMQHRIQSINGSMKIKTSEGKGFTLNLIVQKTSNYDHDQISNS